MGVIYIPDSFLERDTLIAKLYIRLITKGNNNSINHESLYNLHRKLLNRFRNIQKYLQSTFNAGQPDELKFTKDVYFDMLLSIYENIYKKYKLSESSDPIIRKILMEINMEILINYLDFLIEISNDFHTSFKRLVSSKNNVSKKITFITNEPPPSTIADLLKFQKLFMEKYDKQKKFRDSFNISREINNEEITNFSEMNKTNEQTIKKINRMNINKIEKLKEIMVKLIVLYRKDRTNRKTQINEQLRISRQPQIQPNPGSYMPQQRHTYNQREEHTTHLNRIRRNASGLSPIQYQSSMQPNPASSYERQSPPTAEEIQKFYTNLNDNINRIRNNYAEIILRTGSAAFIQIRIALMKFLAREMPMYNDWKYKESFVHANQRTWNVNTSQREIKNTNKTRYTEWEDAFTANFILSCFNK